MAVKVGLVGTGTVGGGCLDILRNHKEEFKRHFGIDIELTRVCSRQPEVADSYGLSDIFTTDFHEVINDPEIDLVIELIGGTTFAKEVVIGALQNGKSVVTANKALMASCGEEVMSLAEEKGVEIAFEASVGGAIPIIVPLKHSLIANRIDSIMFIKDGALYTAPLDNLILPGIARKHLIQACDRLDISVHEEPYYLEDLFAAEEVLVTSSSNLCLHAHEIDGKPVGGMQPELIEALRKEVIGEFLGATEAD